MEIGRISRRFSRILSIVCHMNIIGMASRAHPAGEQIIPCRVRCKFIHQIVSLCQRQVVLLLIFLLCSPAKSGDLDRCTASFEFRFLRNMDSPLHGFASLEHDHTSPEVSIFCHNFMRRRLLRNDLCLLYKLPVLRPDIKRQISGNDSSKGKRNGCPFFLCCFHKFLLLWIVNFFLYSLIIP